MRRIFLLPALLLATSGIGAEPTCNRLNEYWRTYYHADFKIAWARVNFQCVSETSKLALACYDVDWADTDHDFYAVIKDSIGETRLDRDSTDFAYVRGRTLHLGRAFWTGTRTERAGTLFHEAAHTHPRDPMHVTCTQGDKNGVVGACDRRLETSMIGASGYNWEIRLYRFAVKGLSRNGLAVAAARTTLNYIVLNRFNTVTAALRRQWLE